MLIKDYSSFMQNPVIQNYIDCGKIRNTCGTKKNIVKHLFLKCKIH